MKTEYQQLRPYMWRLIILIGMAAVACMALSSCSLESKLSKARQRVRLDSASFEQIGREFVNLHPCVNDSATEVIEGGIDSATLNGYYDWLNGIRPDSQPAYTWRKPNEILRFPVKLEGCADSIGYAYTKGFKDGAADFLAKHPPRLPDKVHTTVKDNQESDFLKKDLAKCKEDGANKDGRIRELLNQNDRLEDKVRGWIWLFVAACVLGVAGIVGVLISKTKLPL